MSQLFQTSVIFKMSTNQFDVWQLDIESRVLDYWKISALKSIPVNQQHSCQPIGAHVWKFLLINTDLTRKFLCNPGIYQIRWVRSQRCACLVTWFCYQMIAKPGNKTAAYLWPGPDAEETVHFCHIHNPLCTHDNQQQETHNSWFVNTWIQINYAEELCCKTPWSNTELT